MGHDHGEAQEAMTWADYEIFLLALCAWREARGEGLDGMVAVMHVVRNRCWAWHKGWQRAITEHGQFSSMSVVGDSQTITWPEAGDVSFGIAMAQAAAVHNGAGDDPTNGALYYWNPLTATSEWFRSNIATKRVMTAQIGKHQFFSDELRPA